MNRWTEAKKARDGGRGMRAMAGVMRRLALAAWNVAARGEAFDPARLFPGGNRPKPRTARATAPMALSTTEVAMA